MNEKRCSEIQLIGEVAKRAESLGLGLSRITVFMDIDNAIEGGCRIDLEKLLSFDDENFAHDVMGINKNLDHTTHKMMNFFSPRCEN